MSSGWVSAELKDCFRLKSGDGLTTKKMIAGEYNVFGGNGVAGTHNAFNLSGDNVIIGRVGALCGNARQIKNDIWLTDNAFKVIDHKFKFDNRFLAYLLNYSDLRSLARQAAQPVISNSSLAGLILNFPKSIEEQKRIVAILDKAFAEIEQARANTEHNLKNARELFESYLQQVFSQRGEGWVQTTIGQEIELLTGFAFKSKEYVSHSDSIPLIRGDNIIQGKLRWEGVKLWPKDNVADYKKYRLERDDILLAMDRTWVKAGMKYARIVDSDLPALLVQRVACLRSKESLNSDYLYHLIGSKLFESYVLSIQTGLGVPHISGKQIQSFGFSKPGLADQEEIVNVLNKLADRVLQLTTLYKSKLSSLEELKRSILQKAFTGELTKQEDNGVAA